LSAIVFTLGHDAYSRRVLDALAKRGVPGVQLTALTSPADLG